MSNTLIVWELDIFQKKLENSLEIKILKQIFIEYKHTIQQRADTLVFIDFMLKDESLLKYTNLFSPNEYKKNDKIILKYFQ